MQGYAVIDPHRGTSACNHCGAVLRTQLNLRSDPEYTQEVDLSPFRRKRGRATSILADVPQWMIDKTRASSAPRDAHRKLREELAHWNQFTQICESDLADVEQRVRRWVATSTPRRIAAALLHFRLHDRFPDESRMRSALRFAKKVEDISYSPPKPSISCGECGALCHTGREARLHCGVMRRLEERVAKRRRM